MLTILENLKTKIHTFDSITGKYIKTFESYEDLTKEWPGAEIVNVVIDNEGCFVYC